MAGRAGAALQLIGWGFVMAPCLPAAGVSPRRKP
jgi:hypothetical protein